MVEVYNYFRQVLKFETPAKSSCATWLETAKLSCSTYHQAQMNGASTWFTPRGRGVQTALSMCTTRVVAEVHKVVRGGVRAARSSSYEPEGKR